MMAALARARKVRVKGRVERKEKTVCESLRLRREKNWEEAGKPAALNSEKRREESVWTVPEEEGANACERRAANAKGKTRNAETRVKKRQHCEKAWVDLLRILMALAMVG